MSSYGRTAPCPTQRPLAPALAGLQLATSEARNGSVWQQSLEEMVMRFSPGETIQMKG